MTTRHGNVLTVTPADQTRCPKCDNIMSYSKDELTRTTSTKCRGCGYSMQGQLATLIFDEYGVPVELIFPDGKKGTDEELKHISAALKKAWKAGGVKQK